MNSKPVQPRSGAEDSGPQGTQVFSRDRIAALLDETTEAPDTVHRPHLTRIGEYDESSDPEVYQLGADRMTIGRSGVCDICLEEPSLSSEHARLVRSEDGWRIINLLSTNGVFVNGEKVFSQRLSDNDTVRLGRVTLRFHNPREGFGNAASASAKIGIGGWLALILVPIAAATAVIWLIL
ncbi:MAG: FHA domain-containing protein [Wenzhouxiangellaceae bacterium]|nr:FHA domain-containing protein [Wenzhouxiangellaceae bacterium]